MRENICVLYADGYTINYLGNKIPTRKASVENIKNIFLSYQDKIKDDDEFFFVVSNHGGRVLDQCPATAEVLAEIADALQGSGMKILVDGGLRNGTDIFKALAMGADGVLICRPFVTALYGGGAEGVSVYIEKLAGELRDTMAMCGAGSLPEITREMVRL